MRTAAPGSASLLCFLLVCCLPLLTSHLHPPAAFVPLRRRSCDPLDLQRLPFAGDLWFVLVNPRFEAPTAEMRAVLRKEVPMKEVGGATWQRMCVACIVSFWAA